MRLVIADDAAIVREGLARLLAANGFAIVGEATDADRLLEVVREQRPDVAIVDIRMPPTHTHEGLAAAAEIRERYPETGVLVLSQYLEPGYAMRLIDQTPSRVGYLLKERVGRVQELTDALRRIDAGECVIDRAVVRELVERERRTEPLAELSERERETLALMAEGRSNRGSARRCGSAPKPSRPTSAACSSSSTWAPCPRTTAACSPYSPTSAQAAQTPDVNGTAVAASDRGKP